MGLFASREKAWRDAVADAKSADKKARRTGKDEDIEAAAAAMNASAQALRSLRGQGK